MTRDWVQFRSKVVMEGRCRYCGTPYGLEAAHIIPRSRVLGKDGAEDPRNCIPLCMDCHRQQHAGRLELLPLMNLEEQGYAAGLVGIAEAFRRTTKEAA